MNDLVEMDDLIDDVLVDLSEKDIVVLTASTTVSTAKTTKHLRGDPLITIYSSGKTRPFSSKNIAHEIMNGLSTHQISSLVPHQKILPS